MPQSDAATTSFFGLVEQIIVLIQLRIEYVLNKPICKMPHCSVLSLCIVTAVMWHRNGVLEA